MRQWSDAEGTWLERHRLVWQQGRSQFSGWRLQSNMRNITQTPQSRQMRRRQPYSLFDTLSRVQIQGVVTMSKPGLVRVEDNRSLPVHTVTPCANRGATTAPWSVQQTHECVPFFAHSAQAGNSVSGCTPSLTPSLESRRHPLSRTCGCVNADDDGSRPPSSPGHTHTRPTLHTQ